MGVADDVPVVVRSGCDSMDWAGKDEGQVLTRSRSAMRNAVPGAISVVSREESKGRFEQNLHKSLISLCNRCLRSSVSRFLICLLGNTTS